MNRWLFIMCRQTSLFTLRSQMAFLCGPVLRGLLDIYWQGFLFILVDIKNEIMKKIFILTVLVSLITGITVSAQQDKSKRASPPATVKETLKSGVSVSIDYSQPSVKGRKIGAEIAPFGKVWRTGANEATIFEVSKNVKVEGKALDAGKYGLYSIPGEKEWTIIFNKKWNQSGTQYAEAEDALRVTVKPSKASSFTEKMTFTIDKAGKVTLLWGDEAVAFSVK